MQCQKSAMFILISVSHSNSSCICQAGTNVSPYQNAKCWTSLCLFQIETCRKMQLTFLLCCVARTTDGHCLNPVLVEWTVFCLPCQTCLTRHGQAEWTCLASQHCGTLCSGGERSFSSMTETVQAVSVAWSYSKVCLCVDMRYALDNWWIHAHTKVSKNVLHTHLCSVHLLSSALAQMGYNLSPQFSQTLVQRFSVRGRQPGIQLDRFIQVCTQLQSMTQVFRERDTAMAGNIRLSYEDFLSGAITRLM